MGRLHGRNVCISTQGYSRRSFQGTSRLRAWSPQDSCWSQTYCSFHPQLQEEPKKDPKSNVPVVSSKNCLLVVSRASTKQCCHFIAQSISILLDWWRKDFSTFTCVYVCKSSCKYTG